jgi:hypothetical protein
LKFVYIIVFDSTWHNFVYLTVYQRLPRCFLNSAQPILHKIKDRTPPHKLYDRQLEEFLQSETNSGRVDAKF